VLFALLLYKGGKVYFGIAPDRKIIGQEISDKTLKSISQKIRQRIKPAVTPEVKVLEIEGKKIIEVKVKEGNNKPYYLDGIAYKRVGTENPGIPPEELERIILEKRKRYWDSELCEGASLDDIDERRLHVDEGITVREALERLNLIKDDELTNATILLFGKNPQRFFLQAETRCARFKGTEPLEFIDMKVFGGNIIDHREDSLEFVKEHIKLHARIVGTECRGKKMGISYRSNKRGYYKCNLSSRL